jgi:hypothetical protein
MKSRRFIAVTLTLLASCAPAPGGLPGPGTQRVDTRNMEPRILAVHNRARADVGVPPLTWSAKLARDAQGWADQIAREGQLRHAPPEVAADQGENLWMGGKGAFTLEAMIDRFVAEKAQYRHRAFPDISTTGDWRDVGHYTQVVWRNTQQVGCAHAEGRTMDFLVCRYWPAGNWRGQIAY